MAEPKPIASLTSGLLARKGAAQPAMRRPMMGFGRSSAVAMQQDDLGWNDMGFDVEPAPVPMEEPPVAIGLTPMAPSAPVAVPVPPVVTEREELAERIMGTPAPPKATVVAKASRKAAFTLRLEANRHLKLRLACAVTGRSAQQIVTQALDEFLNGLPEIDRLTQQLPHMRGDQ
ncbi:MAG: hypothetical protein I8H86_09150 [Sphingomonadaceae bacterium]|nr:hypothetical protein [Sphingomonadaceae bacterium]